MSRFPLVLILFLASPSFAQDWNIRPWDGQMTRDQVVKRISGNEVLFMDGGVASYGLDGRYAYTYDGGRAYEGAYNIEEDGSICIDFDSGPDRCDLYVLHGERLVMIAQNGRRFPVAP